MNKLLTNALVHRPNGEVKPGQILISDDTIAGVYEPGEAPPRNPDLVLDLQGMVVFPSLINAHDHLYDTFWPQPAVAGKYLNWYEWDADYHASQIYRQKQMLSTADLYALGMYRNLLSGVGLIVDHFPREIVLTFANKPFISLLENFFLAHSVSSHKLEWGNGLREEYAQARGVVPFIIHIEEGFDPEITQEMETLHRLGALGENTVLVNGPGLSSADVELIATRHCSFVWSPTSTQRLFQTIPPIIKLLEAGVPMALGTDSAVSGAATLFDELRAFRQLAEAEWPGRFSPADILKLVTSAPAAIFRVDKAYGSIEVGKGANFLIFPDAKNDPYASFFELTPRTVSMVVHRGVLAYGDERYRSVCSVRFDHYSEVLVEGVPKLVWGKPIQLLERIEHKLGEPRRFPFLPVNEL